MLYTQGQVTNWKQPIHIIDVGELSYFSEQRQANISSSSSMQEPAIVGRLSVLNEFLNVC